MSIFPLNALSFCRIGAGLIIAALVGTAQAQTQPAVHPFVQPPVLQEIAPVAPSTAASQQAVLPETEPALSYAASFLQEQNIGFYAKEPCHAEGTIQRAKNNIDVDVKLHLVRGKFTINNPDLKTSPNGEDSVELRSYGGCPAGPTVTVFPGNTVHFDLINDLDQDDPTCAEHPPAGLNLPKGVGCFNSTNLHTHGLHVSPSGNGDNVLLDILPKTKFSYEINLPSDHPAGTFWYHSHRHGATATQVASGAAGVLIVRGNRPYKDTKDGSHPIADIDTILHDSEETPMTEQVFLFQQIPYACFTGRDWLHIHTEKGPYPSYYPKDSPAPKDSPEYAKWTCPKGATPGAVENFNLQLFSSHIWDTSGRFTTINGVVQPTLTVPAGQVQRWRFIHGGIHDTINVQIVRAAKNSNLITNSALTGDRPEQQAQVQQLCVANASTLVPQFEIADDGLTRRHIEKIAAGADAGSNYLQPGYRSDILVVFPEDGDYCLLNQAAPKSERVKPGVLSGPGAGGAGPSIPQLLAYIHVQGGTPINKDQDLQRYVQDYLADNNKDLPASVRTGLRNGDLSPWAPFLELDPPTPGHVQKAEFNIDFPKLLINDASYDPSKVNITRQVDTTDDWVLTALDSPHIYHIHVNPFEVMDVTHCVKKKTGEHVDPKNIRGLSNESPYCSEPKVKDPICRNTENKDKPCIYAKDVVDAKDVKEISIYDENGHCKTGSDPKKLANQYCTMWHTFRDTVFVETGYQVHARMHYDRFIGKFVMHCHILDHEDAGMMLNVEIVPNLGAPDHGIGMGNMSMGDMNQQE